MPPASSPNTLRRLARLSRRYSLSRWFLVLTATVVVSHARASDALAAFALTDLNANSPRVASAVSPRDYTQWISAYYFGNEG